MGRRQQSVTGRRPGAMPPGSPCLPRRSAGPPPPWVLGTACPDSGSRSCPGAPAPGPGWPGAGALRTSRARSISRGCMNGRLQQIDRAQAGEAIRMAPVSHCGRPDLLCAILAAMAATSFLHSGTRASSPSNTLAGDQAGLLEGQQERGQATQTADRTGMAGRGSHRKTDSVTFGLAIRPSLVAEQLPQGPGDSTAAPQRQGR